MHRFTPDSSDSYSDIAPPVLDLLQDDKPYIKELSACNTASHVNYMTEAMYFPLAQTFSQTPSGSDTTIATEQQEDPVAYRQWASRLQDFTPPSTDSDSTTISAKSIALRSSTRQLLEILPNPGEGPGSGSDTLSNRDEFAIWRSAPHQPQDAVDDASSVSTGVLHGARQGLALAPVDYVLSILPLPEADAVSIPSSTPSLASDSLGSDYDDLQSLAVQLETDHDLATTRDDYTAFSREAEQSETSIVQTEGSFSSHLPSQAFEGDTNASTSSYLSEVVVSRVPVNYAQLVGVEIVIPVRALDDPPDRNEDAAASLRSSETEQGY